MLIIDRFEGDDIQYAIIERSEGNEIIEMIEIRRDYLPDDANEGHVIQEINGQYQVDYEETERRRELVKEMTKNLWAKPKPPENR
jgi:hypothetical protein